METLILFIIVVGTSIWVAVDASSIGVKKGQVKGVADMGPAGWFFVCLLLWIVGFPFYLAKRGEFKRINDKTADGRGSPTQSSGGTGNLDELEKLARLKDRGILTEQEFQTQKAKLLGLPVPPPQPQARPTPQPLKRQSPPPPSDNRTVECPLCGKAILLRTVKVGMNNCPHCQGVFEAG